MKSILLVLIVCSAPLAWSHPVSFKDSIGIMGSHAPMMSHNQINYSFKHWFATGVHHIRSMDVQNRSATFASGNFLLKRWNGESFQANLYANIGIGESNLSGKSDAAGFGLLQFDIEDRKYYFLAKHLGLVTDRQTDFYQTVVRAGIAPYEDPFDGLHSWIILEWQEFNIRNVREMSDLTPFLRVFYRNLLFEIGQSFNGVTRFNYIVHF